MAKKSKKSGGGKKGQTAKTRMTPAAKAALAAAEAKAAAAQQAEAKAKLAIIAAQKNALHTGERLLEAAKSCDCKSCRARDFKAYAKMLAEAVVESLVWEGQKSSPLYLQARRLQYECLASYPVCAGDSGFAVEPVIVAAGDICRQSIDLLRSK